MVTTENELRVQSATTLRDESFGDVALSFVVICGAVGGAVGGASLGAEVGSLFPVVCGTLGTMLGGGLAAGAWCLVERLWNAAREHARHERPASLRAAGTR